MRKFVVFALVALMSSLLLCGASYAQQKADRECAARIKTLSQAVELWANDNGGKFPTREEFESEAFLKYVKKADPAAGAACRCCDKGWLYEFYPSGKTYMIKCPNPWVHNASAYYYSRDNGTVQSKGAPLSEKEIKALKEKRLKDQAKADKVAADKAKADKAAADKAKVDKAAADKAKADKAAADKAKADKAAADKAKADKAKADKAKADKAKADKAAADKAKADKAAADKAKADKAAADKAKADKPKTEQPKVKEPVSSREVSEEDKSAILAVIKELYDAYAEKNLDKIMEMQRNSIEASAIDYENQGKGSAQDVRDAYRSATEEILNHKEFKMMPLNTSDLTFQKKGSLCRVTSVVPIIATDRLEISEDGKYFFVRLRIGEFVFSPTENGWEIQTMYLY